MSEKAEQQIEFGLLENGLEFIYSALCMLSEYDANRPDDKRKLKHAVLHLSAGVELVLKERLRQEHWSLVFEDVDKANDTDYKSGNFRSVSFDTCVQRLKSICGIAFFESDRQRKKFLSDLRDKRHRLEHFGILDSIEALTSSSAKALSVLLTFINEELPPDDFSRIEFDMLGNIKSILSDFDALNAGRMKDLQSEIERAVAEYGEVLQCPACFQVAFLLRSGYNPSCLFCGYSAEPEDAAHEWVWAICKISEYEVVKEGGEYPVYYCPECHSKALVSTTGQAAGLGYVCFACGMTWSDDELEFCAECSCPFVASKDDLGMTICPECFDYRISKD